MDYIVRTIRDFWTKSPEATAALIALLGVIISVIASRITAARSLYINAVTVERSKWIDKLRENIANCSGQLRTLNYHMQLAQAGQIPLNREPFVKEINRLVSLINLQLNPFGPMDKNIMTILEKMPALADQPDGAKLRMADNLLVSHSQWLFKAEWEKVKAEARGPILRRWAALRAWYRLYCYRKFCKGEGNLDGV